MKNSNPAETHNVIEPGPVCAATASHLTPTTAVMLSRTRSGNRRARRNCPELLPTDMGKYRESVADNRECRAGSGRERRARAVGHSNRLPVCLHWYRAHLPRIASRPAALRHRGRVRPGRAAQAAGRGASRALAGLQTAGARLCPLRAPSGARIVRADPSGHRRIRQRQPPLLRVRRGQSRNRDAIRDRLAGADRALQPLDRSRRGGAARARRGCATA